MHSKFFLAGAVMLYAHALPGFAQTTPLPSDQTPVSFSVVTATSPLTLDEAVQKGLSASPRMRAAALDIAAAEAQRLQAGLLRNPEASFVREGTQRGTRTETIQFSQVIELGGKRKARIDLAERERSLAAGSLNVVRNDLRAEIASAFFDALSAQQRIEIAEATVDVAGKASLAAERRVAAGRVSPVEEDRSGVALATARLELSQARAELSIALLTLAAYWGETAPVVRNLVPPDLDSVAIAPLTDIQQGLDSTAQLQRARLQVEREEAQVSLDRAQRAPDITLIVGRKKDEELGRSQTVLGVSLPLPLFNRNQGNLRAALSRAEKARAELEAERLRQNQLLISAYQRSQLHRDQLRVMREDILPRAQRVFDAAVKGFEAGKFSFLDILDAQRTLLQIRTQYTQAQLERYRAATDLGKFAPPAGTNSNTRKIP